MKTILTTTEPINWKNTCPRCHLLTPIASADIEHESLRAANEFFLCTCEEKHDQFESSADLLASYVFLWKLLVVSVCLLLMLTFVFQSEGILRRNGSRWQRMSQAMSLVNVFLMAGLTPFRPFVLFRFSKRCRMKLLRLQTRSTNSGSSTTNRTRACKHSFLRSNVMPLRFSKAT